MTLTGLDYLEIVQAIVLELMKDVPLRNIFHSLIYQHDGAPAHYHNSVRAYLDEEFRGRWIGRGGPIAWPTRSPDLTPLDFYLWREIKRRVYATEADTRKILR